MNRTERTRKGEMVLQVVLAIALLAATGCAAKVNRDVLATVKKVGILSISIDKIGTQSTDDEVMQSTVDYAARMYTDALANNPGWKLVPLNYKNNAQIMDFLKPQPAPKQQKSGSEATGLAATLNKINALGAQLETEYSVENVGQNQMRHYLAARDMPVIPCNMIWQQSMGNTSKTKKGTKLFDPSEYREAMLPKIGELASKLDLDGLIVVYLHTRITRAGESITWGGRGLDTIRMEPTMILVSRDGKVAIDIERQIDDLSPSNAGVPLYQVANKGGSFSLGSKRPQGIIDLKDPKGKVQRDFYALTDVAFKDFSKNLAKVLEKN